VAALAHLVGSLGDGFAVLQAPLLDGKKKT
jgi:hypothetical protein